MSGRLCFVTGATGHIGNVLVRCLLARGDVVRALVLPGESLRPLDGLDVELVEGNILDLDGLCRAMAGAACVYHLAGVISIMPGRDEGVHRVNVQGTRNVIRAAYQSRVKRLVYTSSIHALHRVPHGVVIDEKVPFDPFHAISAYDQSKAEASLLVQDAAHLGLDVVLVCPTGVIGPYDYRGSEMSYVILNAMRGGVQFLMGGAYDFVDVRDVAEGLILACEKGRRGETYLLSGEQIQVRDLFRRVQALAGRRYLRLPMPLGLVRLLALFAPAYYRLTKTKPCLTPYAMATLLSNSVISNARARSELGYAPRSLSETLPDTVHWLLQEESRLSSPCD